MRPPPGGASSDRRLFRPDDAFAQYVSAYLPTLRRLALLLCQDIHRGDDLVQGAITKLYIHWDKAAAADNIDAYARAILVREFIHDRRASWARRVTLTERPPETAAPAADRDGALDVRAAVAALPPRQRAALVLRYFCDLTIEQARRPCSARREP
jgi:RNA polymerase sigma factor (sigma-70 family)